MITPSVYSSLRFGKASKLVLLSLAASVLVLRMRPAVQGLHRRALTEQLIKIERIVQMMNARTINAALSFVNIFTTIILLFVIFNSNYQVNDLNIILSAGRYLVGLQH